MRDAAVLFKAGIEARAGAAGDEQRQGKGGISEEAKKFVSWLMVNFKDPKEFPHMGLQLSL